MMIKPETSQALFQEMGIPEGDQVYRRRAFGYGPDEVPAAPKKEGTVNVVR